MAAEAPEASRIRVVADLTDRKAEIGYQSRFLDSLAGILHFTSECSAVARRDDAIILSYNKSIERLSGKEGKATYNFEINLLQRLKSSITNPDPATTQHLIGLYLLSNKSFVQELKGIDKEIAEGDPCKVHSSQLVEFLADTGNAFKVQMEKNKDTTALCATAYESYTNLIKSLPRSAGLSPEQKMQLLRPLQDCVKVYHHLQQNPDLRASITNIHLLPNDGNLHAEHNIFRTIPDGEKATTYVGIAKLSCGYCDATLGPGILNHRGTHGVVDPKWKPDAARAELEAQLPSREEPKRLQHRRLSFDQDESTIVLPANFEGETLRQLKEACAVVPLAPHGRGGAMVPEMVPQQLPRSDTVLPHAMDTSESPRVVSTINTVVDPIVRKASDSDEGGDKKRASDGMAMGDIVGTVMRHATVQHGSVQPSRPDPTPSRSSSSAHDQGHIP